MSDLEKARYDACLNYSEDNHSFCDSEFKAGFPFETATPENCRIIAAERDCAARFSEVSLSRVDQPTVRGHDGTGSIITDSQGTGAATTQNSTSSLISRYDAECKPKLEQAQKCCRNPMQCLGSGDSNSGALGALQAILGASGQAAALSGACGKMKNVALTSAAVNAALATKCTSMISQCKQACNSMRSEANEVLTQCKSRSAPSCAGVVRPTPSMYPNPSDLDQQNRQYQDHVDQMRVDLARITNDGNSCEANENYAQQQASQAIASSLTAKTMGLCKEATTSPKSGSPTDVGLNNLNLDCSNPANASSPSCQNSCNRAGAQNDPACNPNLGGAGFGAGGNSALVDPNGKKSFGDGAALDEVESGQAAMAENIAPTGSKANTSSPAGGGANLGGGDGDSGGSGGLARGAANGDGGGYDPKFIGSGIRTGSGYISPSGGRSVASSSSPSMLSALAAMARGDGKAFNPKDYLPGGRLDPKRRLAGLGSSTSEIGAVHGDIFKNITNRFYQVCLRDALMDCESLRKPGNRGK